MVLKLSPLRWKRSGNFDRVSIERIEIQQRFQDD